MPFTPNFVDLARNVAIVEGFGPVELGAALAGCTSLSDAVCDPCGNYTYWPITYYKYKGTGSVNIETTSSTAGSTNGIQCANAVPSIASAMPKPTSSAKLSSALTIQLRESMASKGEESRRD